MKRRKLEVQKHGKIVEFSAFPWEKTVKSIFAVVRVKSKMQSAIDGLPPPLPSRTFGPSSVCDSSEIAKLFTPFCFIHTPPRTSFQLWLSRAECSLTNKQNVSEILHIWWSFSKRVTKKVSLQALVAVHRFHFIFDSSRRPNELWNFFLCHLISCCINFSGCLLVPRREANQYYHCAPQHSKAEEFSPGKKI